MARRRFLPASKAIAALCALAAGAAAWNAYFDATWRYLANDLPGTTLTVRSPESASSLPVAVSITFSAMVEGVLTTPCGNLVVHGDGDTDGAAIAFDVATPVDNCSPSDRDRVEALSADFERVGSWLLETKDVISLRPDDLTESPILLLVRRRP